MSTPVLSIIGGGLAGCEAAWQAAERGLRVRLYEMRPEVLTGAHVTPFLAELICSNSLGSDLPDRAGGILKQELRSLESLLMRCADECALPAGGALAVDREKFSRKVTEAIGQHPRINVIRQEVKVVPESPTIIATGPLTSPDFARALERFTGQEHLFFYDAIAPIIASDSIDYSVAFKGSRIFGQRGTVTHGGEGDYLNCPLNREEYYSFVDKLINAERIPLKGFEIVIESGVTAGAGKFFEGCLPVEVLARRECDALAYGPLRPVGLIDPRCGKRPFAVVQLRQDNHAATLYNMVGFQTNLTYPEQRRVFRMIPGLENAVFERYGQMHRNTFIDAPAVINATLQSKRRESLFFAGQIIGVEGYAGNIATGLLAGINASRFLHGQELILLPRETLIGALCFYVSHANPENFQPMKANLGLLPPLDGVTVKLGRRAKGKIMAERSAAVLKEIEI